MTCLRYIAALVFALAFVVPGSAAAHGYKHKGLEIVHPWCFATKEKSDAVSIYMVIKNPTKRADKLVGAHAADGRRIELREASGAVAASFALPPGKETVLKRGARHLVVVGEGTRFEANESFLATLTFERAGKIEVEVMVEEAPKAPSH